MTKATKEEIVELKLKQAFKLMKDERYGASRHILRQFPDNPKAQAMLKLMEGKVEKRRGFSAITPRSVLTIASVITVMVLIAGFCGLLVYYASRYTLDEWFVLGTGAFGDGDSALLGPAISYCHISQDWKKDVCEEWPLIIYTQHEDALDNCFEPYRGRIFLELDEVLSIRQCLRSYAVPATY
jgi:hypothetical protein